MVLLETVESTLSCRGTKVVAFLLAKGEEEEERSMATRRVSRCMREGDSGTADERASMGDAMRPRANAEVLIFIVILVVWGGSRELGKYGANVRVCSESVNCL